MNIYEFAEKYRLSLAKVKKMAKAGDIVIDGSEATEAGEIRQLLKRGQPITAGLMLWLVENPDALLTFGTRSDKARELLADLDKPEKAPVNVQASLRDAARGNAEAVGVLITWAKAVLPPREVGHSYLAVRLLLGSHFAARPGDLALIPQAFLKMRLSDDFAGWWKAEEKSGRNVSKYFAPKVKKAQKPLDL